MPIHSQLKEALGAIAAILRPGLASAVASGDPTALSHRWGKLISWTETRRAARRKAWPELRSRLAGYWQGGEGNGFYDAWPERFDQWFLKDHYSMIEALVAAASHESCTELVEIGCGDGRVLEHLAGRMPHLTQLTGIDINSGIIQKNRATYSANPKLKFEAVDALEWLPKNVRPGTMVVTYGGVWEYFTGEELRKLFSHLSQQAAPVIIGLVEPIGADFDPSTETTSRPYGAECSFSHPYRAILEASGFSVLFEKEVHLDHRWTLMTARTKDHSHPG